jgi:Bifunctional DNA primase/polymerase, N-terminal/Primase C terminal 2 (PriCT-2)
MFRRYPRADIGVATGAQSGIFVLDVDTVDGHGVDGAASLAALERMHRLILPRTRTAVTPTGGRHYYFWHPGVPVTSSTSRLGPGLDIIGDGGMVIAPPSRGRTWQSTAKIALAPRCILDVVRERPQRRTREPQRPRAPIHPSSVPPELLALMRADSGSGVSTDPHDTRAPDDTELKVWCALQVVPADTDYLTWFRIGCAIHAGLGDAGFEMFDDWSREAPHKYPRNGCADKWRECAKTTAIRVDTLYWIADQYDRGWRDAYRVLLSKENA